MEFHYFLGIDFRIVFSSFFDEKGSQNGGQKHKMQRPKSIPGTYFFDTLSFMLILCRISVACGNSSAPGPREDSLHAKIWKKLDARVNAGVFFADFDAKK